MSLPFKVFVVALHKSGTSSLHDFAVRAGLKSSHSPAVDNGVNYEKRIIPHIDDHAAILNVMAPVIERYDVHGDIPWSGLYRAAQKSYPDARFVLMERDADQWWESIAAHWSLGTMSRRVRPYEVVAYSGLIPAQMRVISLADKALLTDAYRRHGDQVRRTIAADNLLEIDLANPQASDQLAAFIGADAASPIRRVNSRWSPARRVARNLWSAVRNRYAYGTDY
jgi:hypothetical protein